MWPHAGGTSARRSPAATAGAGRRISSSRRYSSWLYDHGYGCRVLLSLKVLRAPTAVYTQCRGLLCHHTVGGRPTQVATPARGQARLRLSRSSATALLNRTEPGTRLLARRHVSSASRCSPLLRWWRTGIFQVVRACAWASGHRRLVRRLDSH